MSKKKTYTEKTSADAILIAFDYQYYFFLWKLLSLGTGESVGLEVKDDVHTELDNNDQILYQVKHTVKTKADGTLINLTASDPDLWKTLSNWAKVICDENDNRENKIKQLLFLKKTSFVLASNKSLAKNNNILKGIISYQNDTVSIPNIKNTFQELKDNSEDNKLSSYIESVLEMNDEVLSEYLLRITFELNEADIIQKCKDAIKADKIMENKIDDVFKSIDSSIRSDNFIKIKDGKKIEITFDDFYLKYRRHYDRARSADLNIKEFSGSLPDKLENQIFIKQLLEIGDITDDDIESIADFTRFRLKLENNVSEWLQKGELTSDEVESLKNDAINKWKNEFRKAYRESVGEGVYNSKGVNILDSVRKENLEISGIMLKVDMSNGAFYELSNMPQIGWRKDWSKYKK